MTRVGGGGGEDEKRSSLRFMVQYPAVYGKRREGGEEGRKGVTEGLKEENCIVFHARGGGEGGSGREVRARRELRERRKE